MVDKKWNKITQSINSVGKGSSLLTNDQVQKKCFNLKSSNKKVVSKYNIESKGIGGGTNTAKQPSEFQIRIADFIGAAYIECILGTEE